MSLDFVELKNLLLVAPDRQLADEVKPMVEKWAEPIPTALSILHVLDVCAHGSLASDFCMTTMDVMLQEAIKAEGTTFQELIEKADWRKEHEV